MARHKGAVRANVGPLLAAAPATPEVGDTYTSDPDIGGNGHSFVYVGGTVGWYDLTASTAGPPLSPSYTITNDLTDRAFNANAVSIDELADVLATLIRDLGAGNRAAYAVTNVSADRTYDANLTSIDELADVVGTLISDLQASGWLT